MSDNDAEGAPPSPLRPVKSPDEQSAPGPSPSAISHGVVLVVDDDEGLRESLVDILRLQGHLALEARDGSEALAILSHLSVDLLILDLAMPKTDGVQVLLELDPPPPTVILHSAFEYFTAETLEHMGVSGKVFRMLRKPVPPAQLLKAVGDALR